MWSEIEEWGTYKWTSSTPPLVLGMHCVNYRVSLSSCFHVASFLCPARGIHAFQGIFITENSSIVEHAWLDVVFPTEDWGKREHLCSCDELRHQSICVPQKESDQIYSPHQRELANFQKVKGYPTLDGYRNIKRGDTGRGPDHQVLFAPREKGNWRNFSTLYI